MKLSSLSAFFPAYNEEMNIPRLVEAFYPALNVCADEFEMIIVNDGSQDGTARVANELVSKYPGLRVVSHETNKGYGGAVKTGLQSSRMEYVFMSDGDLQFDPSEFSLLLEKIGDYDLVTGFRKNRQENMMRKLNAWGWSQLIGLLLGIRLRDLDCAFKLFSKEMLGRINLDTLESDGAFISAEIVMKIHRAQGRIAEVPVSHLPRTTGNPTGANPKVILKAFQDLWMFRRYWFGRSGSSLIEKA